MIDFLQANWGTILAFVLVIFLVFLAVRRMRKDKKKGIGPCGQKCSKCPNSAKCNKS